MDGGSIDGGSINVGGDDPGNDQFRAGPDRLEVPGAHFPGEAESGETGDKRPGHRFIQERGDASAMYESVESSKSFIRGTDGCAPLFRTAKEQAHPVLL